ncbi:hypothetical protein UlMin_034744 [Ulmus minor]
MAATLKNLVRVGRFSSSSSKLSSSASVSWISPFKLANLTSREPDPPTKSTSSSDKPPRKIKYITHMRAAQLINRERKPQRALEVFNTVGEQIGFSHNHITYNAILARLAMCKKFKAVDAILDRMNYETCKFRESIFLDLMKHFSRASMHERVLDMFYSIEPIVREKPSLRAISTCLNFLIESCRVDLVREFLLHCKEKLDLKPNTCMFNIIIKHHCRNGHLNSAFEVLEEMNKSRISYPNLITYSTLMSGLCESGKLKGAMDLFEEMVSKDQIVPDHGTYNVLIQGFCKKGYVDRARKIMEFMRSNGCSPNVFNYATLMRGFGDMGKIQEAEEIFNEMKSYGLKCDNVAYTTMMHFFCMCGRTDEAMELLKEMRRTQCRPDVVTFNVILGGLCREFRLEEALEMLEKLPTDGIYLNRASYRIVLNVLLEKSELKKAIDLLDLMLSRGFIPHFATSNHLLVCLCEAGMPDDAAKSLFGLTEMGFKPTPESWALLVELVSRQRKLLSVFEQLDQLVMSSLR